MGIGNPEDEALNKILGDMDGMESGRMFGSKPGDASKGVSITISVVPNGEKNEMGDDEEDEYPEGHDIGMCKGGCVAHMASGGVVPNTPAAIPSPVEEEDKTLPPFLRKKKKSLPAA